MMALEFFRWWYTHGWTLAFVRLRNKLTGIEQAFSVGILLRTLFAPWRRIITYPGDGIGAHFRAMIDNLVSRFIGFMVRIFVLIGAGVTGLIFGCFALLACVLWPLLPPLAIGALVWSIAG